MAISNWEINNINGNNYIKYYFIKYLTGWIEKD